MNVPMIAYYDGVPLSDVPREDLERLLCEAHEQIRRLQEEVSARSVAHINDLASIGPQRLRG